MMNPMVLASVFFVFGGLIALAVSQRTHQSSAFGSPLTRTREILFRGGGTFLLLLSTGLWMQHYGVSIGLVAAFTGIALAAVIVALLLFRIPRILPWIGWVALIAGLLAGLWA